MRVTYLLMTNVSRDYQRCKLMSFLTMGSTDINFVKFLDPFPLLVTSDSGKSYIASVSDFAQLAMCASGLLSHTRWLTTV